MMHKWLGHEGEVYCLAVSPDSRWIACGCGSDAVRVWDVHAAVQNR
jgi:WD40 repeat protein